VLRQSLQDDEITVLMQLPEAEDTYLVSALFLSTTALQRSGESAYVA
jgi:hypothetical protein